VEEVTVVKRAVGSRSGGAILASVRLDLGPVVVAGSNRPIEAGMRVTLETVGAGVRVCPAADPGTSQKECKCL
jgi:ribosomal protein L2